MSQFKSVKITADAYALAYAIRTRLVHDGVANLPADLQAIYLDLTTRPASKPSTIGLSLIIEMGLQQLLALVGAPEAEIEATQSKPRRKKAHAD